MEVEEGFGGCLTAQNLQSPSLEGSPWASHSLLSSHPKAPSLGQGDRRSEALAGGFLYPSDPGQRPYHIDSP